MAEVARVDSIEALRTFRAALWKFQESVSVALADAESDLMRTLVWLETEQQTHWTQMVRKCTEAVAAAKDKVRQKKLFKDSSGKLPSAIDEEKALAIAQRRLAEAEEKLAATRKWSRKLQREIHNYKGGAQRLGTAVAVDLPVAVAKLDKYFSILERYASLAPAMATSEAGMEGGFVTATEGVGSMARGEGREPPKPQDIAARPDFPKVQSPQVVLGRLGASGTGEAEVPADGTLVACASIEDAQRQAKEQTSASSGARYAIYDPTGQRVEVIEPPAP